MNNQLYQLRALTPMQVDANVPQLMDSKLLPFGWVKFNAVSLYSIHPVGLPMHFQLFWHPTAMLKIGLVALKVWIPNQTGMLPLFGLDLPVLVCPHPMDIGLLVMMVLLTMKILCPALKRIAKIFHTYKPFLISSKGILTNSMLQKSMHRDSLKILCSLLILDSVLMRRFLQSGKVEVEWPTLAYLQTCQDVKPRYSLFFRSALL